MAYRTPARSIPGDQIFAEVTRNSEKYPYFIEHTGRIASFQGVGATFRIVGNAATPQNLWTLENATGSTVFVALKTLDIVMHQSGASVVLPPWFSLTRISTVPTGGTAITKTAIDTGDGTTSSGSVTSRGAASADGIASAITATAAGQRLASASSVQLYTAVGLSGNPEEIDVLKHVPKDWVLVLRAGQSFLLQIIAAAAADNIATRSMHVNFAWEEFTLPA